jgi:hypothetical protein
MSEDSYEEYFIDSILLVALTQCFRPGEHYLTSEQLFERGFAPLRSYCAYCVDRLVSRSLVVSKFLTAPGSSHGTETPRYIGLLTDQRQTPYEPVRSRLDSIISTFSETVDCFKHLIKLEREIQVCECIEVSDFYASIWGVKFQNILFSNPKLALIIEEKNIEIAQTLILRILKRAAKEFGHSHEKPFDLNSSINDAYELYLRCKRRGIHINGQPRPIPLKRSILAEMLEDYLSEI